MMTREKWMLQSTDHSLERKIASDALARLPKLLGVHRVDGSPHASVGCRSIATRLFLLAALSGDVR